MQGGARGLGAEGEAQKRDGHLDKENRLQSSKPDLSGRFLQGESRGSDIFDGCKHDAEKKGGDVVDESELADGVRGQEVDGEHALAFGQEEFLD